MVVIAYTHDQFREEDLIHCNACKTQIGFVEDHLDNVQNDRIGVFNSVFNVQILDNMNFVRHVNGNTVADVYCVCCGMLLGLKLLSVPQPSLEIYEGRFLMNLEKLVYWNDIPMIYQEQDGSNACVNQVLYELGGGQILPAQQTGLASVGPALMYQNGLASIGSAPMDEDGGAIDQIANRMSNLDLNRHI